MNIYVKDSFEYFSEKMACSMLPYFEKGDVFAAVGFGHLSGVAYKAQYLRDNRSGFASIKKGCEQMSLARSTYYYQIKNRQKVLEKDKQDTDLKDLIDEIHTTPALVFMRESFVWFA